MSERLKRSLSTLLPASRRSYGFFCGERASEATSAASHYAPNAFAYAAVLQAISGLARTVVSEMRDAAGLEAPPRMEARLLGHDVLRFIGTGIGLEGQVEYVPWVFPAGVTGSSLACPGCAQRESDSAFTETHDLLRSLTQETNGPFELLAMEEQRMRELQRLPDDPELSSLLEKICDQKEQRDAEDIGNWARRLAEDAGGDDD